MKVKEKGLHTFLSNYQPCAPADASLAHMTCSHENLCQPAWRLEVRPGAMTCFQVLFVLQEEWPFVRVDLQNTTPTEDY